MKSNILRALYFLSCAVLSAACSTLPLTFKQKKEQMVERDLIDQGICDARILTAEGTLPLEEFVLPQVKDQAYSNKPLPVGYGQTIGTPYSMALMLQSARLMSQDKVLDLGTGSGYFLAAITYLTKQVYSVEIIKPLAMETTCRLQKMGYTNIHFKVGDGLHGWTEHAPYKAIFVHFPLKEIPSALVAQLVMGGRVILQTPCVKVYRKTPAELVEEPPLILDCRCSSAFISNEDE